jgi:hypothetical protein
MTNIVESGTYTPTITESTNIASSSLHAASYVRIGSMVHVAIMATIDTTTGSSASIIKFSLPFSSDITAFSDVIGAGASTVDDMSGTFNGSTGDDTALLAFDSNAGATSQLWGMTFQYEIK